MHSTPATRHVVIPRMFFVSRVGSDASKKLHGPPSEFANQCVISTITCEIGGSGLRGICRGALERKLEYLEGCCVFYGYDASFGINGFGRSQFFR